MTAIIFISVAERDKTKAVGSLRADCLAGGLKSFEPLTFLSFIKKLAQPKLGGPPPANGSGSNS